MLELHWFAAPTSVRLFLTYLGLVVTFGDRPRAKARMAFLCNSWRAGVDWSSP
jgi:hypothetical protein